MLVIDRVPSALRDRQCRELAIEVNVGLILHRELDVPVELAALKLRLVGRQLLPAERLGHCHELLQICRQGDRSITLDGAGLENRKG